MDNIKQKYANDPNPYKAQAYRRTAIVAANVSFPLLSEKGLKMLRYYKKYLGFCDGDTTSSISCYVEKRFITDEVQQNPFKYVPNTKSDNQPSDITDIPVAIEAIQFCIGASRLYCEKWNEFMANDSRKKAYEFYKHRSWSELEIIKNHIQTLLPAH